MKPDLGMIVRDRITGYTGVVIARTTWLNQCARLTVQSREMKDGKPIDSVSFDEIDLEILESETQFSRLTEQLKVEKEALPSGAPVHTGGPRPDPQRR